MCVCVRLTLIHLITQTGDNVAVRVPQAQPPLHTIHSVKAFLREKVHNVAFWAMYRSGNAACRCPEDASSSPRSGGLRGGNALPEAQAAPVVERAAAGVWWVGRCLFFLFSDSKLSTVKVIMLCNRTKVN